MTVFASVPEDDDLFARLENRAARRARARAQVQADPDLARRVAGIHGRWVNISATVALRLAQAGIEPSDPGLAEVAKGEHKKGGFSIGSIVSAAGRLGDTVFGGVDEALTAVAKPIVRGAAVGAQSLYEEAQGVVRNVAAISPQAAGAAVGAGLGSIVPGAGTAIGAGIGGALGAGLGHLARDKIQGEARWEPQSAGAVALGRLLAGEKVELGSGFLPDVDAGESEVDPDSTWTVGEEQRQRARNVTVGGMSLTPGRLLTAGVAEPGTKPFNVLSGLADGALALSRFDPASAMLKTGGNVNRNRRLFTEAGGIFSSRPTILPEVADAWLTKGGRDLVTTLAGEGDFYTIWKATKGKLGARLTRDVADAPDEAAVLDLLRPALGTTIREKPTYTTFRPLANVRLAQTMPGRHFDPFDADDAVTVVERWLKNANASEELIASSTRLMAEANTRVGRMGALTDVMKVTEDLLIEKGVDPSRAKTMTRLEQLANEDARAFFKDELYRDVEVPGMWIGGTPHSTTSPHLFNEFINRTLTLPDARDIRQATSGFSAVVDKALYKDAVSAVDFAQGNLWKKSALLRGAYTVRVIAEEQFRMAASGLDSLVNHPLSLISYRIGRKGKKDLDGGAFRYADEADFDEGLDEFNRSLNREWAGWADQKKTLPIWRRFRRNDPEFVNAWSGEILQLASDPVAREVARGAGALDAVKDSFWDGSLQNVRKVMAEEATGLLDRATADRYIDSILDRIQIKTGSDSTLLDAIASGNHGGVSIRQGTKASKEFKAHLAANTAIAPEYVKGQMSIVERGASHRLDQATKWLFSNLMSERTNNLSRSPTFKQFYAQRVEELVPFMDANAQTRSIQWARDNDLGDVAERMQVAVGKRGGRVHATPVDFDTVDDIAKGWALDSTRNLLFDMTEKSQFFDAYRMIFPFGEAWMEMITRWSKIGAERPQAFRRGQQVITGAREAGFFYQNENDEEVFAYPGSEWISEKLIGVPVPLTGRVAGLSLMTEVLPGVGPVVQFPAAAFLPDKPEWDFARNIMFPFAEPDTDHGVLESLAPAWLKKFMTSREIGDERMFNSSVMDVARYLVSTGDYDTSTVDGINDLLDEAKEKARSVFMLRGAAQFFAPTAPTPEWLVEDQDGRGLVAQKLVGEYHDLLEVDPQNATRAMLDRYGPNLFLLLQGKTAEVVAGAPITKAGADWERANAEVVKAHPEVFGFFAPQGGDLDSAAFDRQMSLGRRVPLTPDQAVRLANNRVANAVYQNAKAKMPSPNRAQQTWLRGLREVLIQQYPGFTEASGVPENASVDQLVRGLEAAVADERLADNPNTTPVRQYLQARDKAMQAAEGAGLAPTSFGSAQAMAPVRAWLRGLADVLIREHPQFEPVWSRVFERELKDDDVIEEAAA